MLTTKNLPPLLPDSKLQYLQLFPAIVVTVLQTLMYPLLSCAPKVRLVPHLAATLRAGVGLSHLLSASLI